MKKTIFTVMKFLVPPQGVLPIHCAVNEGRDGRVAIFLGISGTGKSTLLRHAGMLG